jgi:hypothetical protein
MSPLGTPGAPWQTAQCAAKCATPVRIFAGSSSLAGASMPAACALIERVRAVSRTQRVTAQWGAVAPTS